MLRAGETKEQFCQRMASDRYCFDTITEAWRDVAARLPGTDCEIKISILVHAALARARYKPVPLKRAIDQVVEHLMERASP